MTRCPCHATEPPTHPVPSGRDVWRWDPELEDRVKTCRRCREEWPLDREFFSQRTSDQAWRHICRACDAEMAQERRRAS